MRTLIQTAAIIAFLSLFPSAIVAQDFDAGVTAYSAGDYEAALKEFSPLAEQGNASAQKSLGVMYGTGEGVPQDYVHAHMWANLAFANGFEQAEKIRDSLAAKMTQPDISKAQAMARECLESDYKNCP